MHDGLEGEINCVVTKLPCINAFLVTSVIRIGLKKMVILFRRYQKIELIQHTIDLSSWSSKVWVAFVALEEGSERWAADDLHVFQSFFSWMQRSKKISIEPKWIRVQNLRSTDYRFIPFFC